MAQRSDGVVRAVGAAPDPDSCDPSRRAVQSLWPPTAHHAWSLPLLADRAAARDRLGVPPDLRDLCATAWARSVEPGHRLPRDRSRVDAADVLGPTRESRPTRAGGTLGDVSGGAVQSRAWRRAPGSHARGIRSGGRAHRRRSRRAARAGAVDQEAVGLEPARRTDGEIGGRTSGYTGALYRRRRCGHARRMYRFANAWR